MLECQDMKSSTSTTTCCSSNGSLLNIVEKKLYISYKETGKSECYTIHPHIVAFGGKGSKYLADIMSQEALEQQRRHQASPNEDIVNKTTDSTCTIVELNVKYAPVIPYFLNFAYFYASQEDDEDILGTDGTINTFQTLYELSVHWEISALRVELAKYQRQHFTLDTALGMLVFADQFSSSPSSSASSTDELLDATIDWYADHIFELEPSQAGDIEPHHLFQILEKNMELGIEVRVDDFIRSKMVAHCIHQNCSPLLLTKTLLDKLTNETLLPFISPRFEASVFLIAESRLSKHGETPAYPRNFDDDLTDLEQRCIQSITTFWQSCCSGIVSSTLPAPWGGEKSTLTQASNSITSSGESTRYNLQMAKKCMLEFFGELRKSVLNNLLEQTTKFEIGDHSTSYGTLAFTDVSSSRKDLLWAAVEPFLESNPTASHDMTDDEETENQEECFIIEDGIIMNYYSDCSFDASVKSSLPSLLSTVDNGRKNRSKILVSGGKNQQEEDLDDTLSLSSIQSDSIESEDRKINEVRIVSLVPGLIIGS